MTATWAHLTVVMASLAVARYLQEATGISIKRVIRALKPLQDVTINLNGRPPHCSAPAHPDRSRNPQIPQALKTLRRQESGTNPAPLRALTPLGLTHLVGVWGWDELYEKYKDVGRGINTNIGRS